MATLLTSARVMVWAINPKGAPGELALVASFDDLESAICCAQRLVPLKCPSFISAVDGVDVNYSALSAQRDRVRRRRRS